MALVDLEGKAGVFAEGEFPFMSCTQSMADGLARIDRDEIVTSAGDNGAINFYKGDDGLYRVQLYRWCMLIADCATPNIDTAKEFFCRQWPEIARCEPEEEPN